MPNPRFARLLALVLLVGALCCAQDAPLVAVCWYKKSGMAERVLKGLSEELKQRGDPIQLKVQANLVDEAAALAAIQAAVAGGAKGIACLRSDGAKLLVAHPPGVPGFIGAAGDPIELGVCSDLAKPDHLITGVTYHLPIERTFAVYRAIWPKLASVGLVVQQGHPSAAIEQASTKRYCEANSIAYKDVACASRSELSMAVSTLRGQVDLLIGGNQALLIDNGQLVAQLAAKTPYVSYAEKPVTDRHALLGVVPDDLKLGRQLAAAMIAVLVDGKPVTAVPITGDDAPRLVVNQAKAEALGLTIPADLLAGANLLK